MTNTLNGNRATTVVVDDLEGQSELNAGFYETVPSKPITIPTYPTFRSALTNTTAIQTISRRG